MKKLTELKGYVRVLFLTTGGGSYDAAVAFFKKQFEKELEELTEVERKEFFDEFAFYFR